MSDSATTRRGRVLTPLQLAALDTLATMIPSGSDGWVRPATVNLPSYRLHDLVKYGYVEARGPKRRTEYRITESGRRMSGRAVVDRAHGE